jgi:hypothetical protein
MSQPVRRVVTGHDSELAVFICGANHAGIA